MFGWLFKQPKILFQCFAHGKLEMGDVNPATTHPTLNLCTLFCSRGFGGYIYRTVERELNLKNTGEWGSHKKGLGATAGSSHSV